MIYILLFLFLLIPVIRYDLFAKKGGEKLWYWTSVILLVLVAGLRYRVGGDTLVYMAEYSMYPKLDELAFFDFETARYNPLWYIIASVARSIDDNFICFQILHALIVNISFFHFFRKYCPRYYFSAILVWFVGYWCYFSFEVLREVLCISLLLWCIDFLLEKKYLRYYIMCIVALFIHYSAAVMLFFPLLPLVFKRPNWKFQVLILGAVVLFTTVVNIPSLIVGMFSLDEQLEIVIENYFENDMKNIVGKLFEIFSYLPVLGVVWLRERNQLEDEYDFMPIVSLMVVFYGFSSYLGVAGRFLNYMAPFFVVMFVNTVYDILSEVNWRERHVTSIITLCAVTVLSFNYLRYYFKDTSDVYPGTHAYCIFVPYHSVFNPQVDNTRESYVENLRDFAIIF